MGVFKNAYNSSIKATETFFPFFLEYIIHPRTTLLDIISADIPVATKFLKSMQESLKKPNEISKTKLFHYIVFKKVGILSTHNVVDKLWLFTKKTSALGDVTGSLKWKLKY